ncbi:hypothetical protein JOC93_003575 [Priestia taiwanensis]|nr:hypothetical protein [Priestia taiwanensis]
MQTEQIMKYSAGEFFGLVGAAIVLGVVVNVLASITL